MSGFESLLKKFDSGNTAEPELPPPSRSGSLESFIQKFGGVTEEYHFYNNTVTLRFNVEEHRYYRVAELGNLIPLNGVTTTVGIIDKSHMLTPWAAKMAIQKLLRLMPTEMVEGVIRIKALTFEEFTTIALEAKSAHKDKLDEASDCGHAAHKCLEDSINNAMQNDPDKIVRALINLPTDERAANAASNALVCMYNHNIRWMETETKIYSREFDYAGTMDGLAKCDSCQDKACCPVPFKDRVCLIDWKSSNYLKIEYLMQTASYKHAKMEEQPDLKIEDIFLFRLGKSEEEAGKFESWHMTPDEYEEDFQGFLACLRLTRLVDSIEERMKSQKSTIRAVKKEQRESAKTLAKEQAKLQKAIDKAAVKVAKEAEKLRIKAEAKATRDAAKLAKLKPQEAPCTSTLETTTLALQAIQYTLSGSTVLEADSSLRSPDTPTPKMPQPESTTLTVETLILSPADQKAVIGALLDPPEPSKALTHAFVNQITEEFYEQHKFNLPMEGLE